MLGKSIINGSHSKRNMTIQGEGKGPRPGKWTEETSLSGTAKDGFASHLRSTGTVAGQTLEIYQQDEQGHLTVITSGAGRAERV
jgi:hypothetical protein